MPTKATRLLLGLLVSLFLPCAGWAHPMGNFSVNHYTKITLQNTGIKIQYLIDLAEIPAYQELQQGNITANAPESATARFSAARGIALGRGLTLSLDGRPLPLHLKSSSVIFPPGAGGLPTMKMGFVYETPYPPGLDRNGATLRYADHNYDGRTGWKEIIAVVASGSLLKSSVPQTDRSAELTNYPTDLLSSPPQDLDAALTFSLPPEPAPGASATSHLVPSRQPARLVPSGQTPLPATPAPHARASVPLQSPVQALPGPVATTAVTAAPSEPAMQLKANRQETPRSRFTGLITAQNLSAWFLFTSALIAIGLGALHALEPGHGKTIVAAYLVGSKGTARHAVLLGLIVTASHTAGVFALGAITVYASRYIVPEQLYPWLGVVSGLTIAVLGLYMLLRRWTGTASDHTHLSGESHFRWLRPPTVRSPESGATVRASTEPVSLTQLLTLGITGGIIPCPAALIVLLSAFALHRVALGFFLIVAFSFGLAAVLISFGLMMVYARRFMTHLELDGPLTKRWLPVASAVFITVLGVVVASQAFSATQLSLHSLSKERLGPLLFVTGLGLLLGMRHSTDADHIVAISTIISKQRSLRNAAIIGSVWGLGHTLTIFVVGALIILFGLQIPPRVGLSMEFSVAIMLVLLGVLNLTGIMRKITARFTPQSIQLAPLAESDLFADSRVAGFGKSISRFGIFQCLRPLVIGIVHGLAGSAAVALLVLSTIHNPVWATFYLLVFGAGTMAGMMGMTAAITVPLIYAGDHFAKVSRYLGVASGMVSLCFGGFLMYRLGYVGGLFTNHPHWTPQ